MNIVSKSEEDGIVTIQFDDGKANVLNSTSLSALDQALEASRSAKAVLLKGREGCFCGGLDLKTLPSLEPAALNATLKQFADLCVKLLTFPRPIVAAVDGHAIAGGTVILLCCDARVGSARTMKIGLSEVAIGLALPSFVIRLAERAVPADELIEAVLHGRLYSSQEAAKMGYLGSVVSEGEVLERSRELATKLGALPNPAYRTTKERMLKPMLSSMEQFSEEMTSMFSEAAKAHAANFKK